MPRIAAPTVAENRELRRQALLVAAATLMRRGNGFTVKEVAREVGLSRSAVYEYYSSAAELIADVLVDELELWSQSLSTTTEGTPRERVRAWLDAVLDYVVDGRHALLRSAGSVDLPPARRAQVAQLHQSLIAPLVDALRASGSSDADREAHYVWGVVDVSIARIESERVDIPEERSALIAFVERALADERAAVADPEPMTF